MKYAQLFAAFMLVEASLLGATIGFFAKPETAQFIRTSPWMLLYYAPFAAIIAFVLGKK